jgi:hypothetical protein
MAGREPRHYGAVDTIVHDNYAHVVGSVGEDGREPEPDDPIPGWRKPIALVGWGVLIAVLLGLIVWGIGQLAQNAPPQGPTTTIAPTETTATSTTPPSSAAPVTPPTRQRQEGTTTATTPATEAPPASTENSGTPTTTTSSPSPGAFPFPQLPSVITLPSLPGLPTEITLPPGP